MKIEIDGSPGLRIEVVGYPWNRKKYGPPYLRLETGDGKYLWSPKYKELKKLGRIVSLLLKYERQFDPNKKSKKEL